MKKILLICLLILLLASCGYKEGIIQKAEQSYLKFTGNWQAALVQIDDIKPFKLRGIEGSSEAGAEVSAPEGKLYQISPGRHDIKIYKSGNVVVNRILLLENQATTEVFIP